MEVLSSSNSHTKFCEVMSGTHITKDGVWNSNYHLLLREKSGLSEVNKNQQEANLQWSCWNSSPQLHIIMAWEAAVKEENSCPKRKA